MNKWITDWAEIDPDDQYLVCPINESFEGNLYLGQPIGFNPGWQVRRLMPGCYAAILLPPWVAPGSAPSASKGENE